MKHGNAKYPLELMLAVCLREERKLYPQEFLQTIPRSTLSFWRSKPPQFFIQQFEDPESQEIVKRAKSKESHEAETRKKITASYFKFLQFIKDRMGEKEYLRFLSANKRDFLVVVDSLEGAISKNIFLEAAGVSKNRYWSWKIETTVKCESSYDSVCIRKRPHKTTKQEVQRIRRIAMKGGPNKYAIWATALKEGKIAVGKQTFYTYTKDILTEKQHRKVPKKNRKVRANAIHEIWHADISIIFTADGKKHCLYCVMDNYSRAVLAWRIEDRVRKSISAEVLYDAFMRSCPEKVKYMTDGGSENRNILDTDLPEIKFKVTHLVAQKNGIPSNSMIERVFHTLKNEYKRVVNAQDKGHLIKVVTEVIQAYMDRPHSAHGVYSPREVLMKTSGWFDKKAVLYSSAKARLEANKNAKCSNCENCTCSTPFEWDVVGSAPKKAKGKSE